MRECRVLRVFTRGQDGGNHLGVVTEIEGLDDDDMQAIATDLGYSETIFLDLGHGDPPSVRIFTPGGELPFAGHPLVGAAWFIASTGSETSGTIACGVGEVVTTIEGDLGWIDPPMGGRSVEPTPLDTSGWAEPVSAVVVTMPMRYHVLQLGGPSDVAAATAPPVEDDVYLWAWDEPGRSVKARFFAPALGVPEDPATGSAAVALAEALIAAGHDNGDIVITQGDEIGAPSTLHLRWTPDRISVGGTVADDGTIHVAG